MQEWYADPSDSGQCSEEAMEEPGAKEALHQWEAQPAFRTHPSSSHLSCRQPDAGLPGPRVTCSPTVGPLPGPRLVLKTLILALRAHDITYM